MRDRGHVYQPGEDPLAPHPMTQAQRDALIRYCLGRRDHVAMKAVAASGPRSRLSEQAKAEICAARKAGRPLAKIAEEHGISVGYASRIANGLRLRSRP